MFIQEMTKDECLRALAGTRLGRLACAHENQPYIVPVYLAYEEPYLYGFTTPGQKVEWMRSNPLVCVELDEVVDPDQWTSLIVFGRYEELPGTPEGEQAWPHSQEPSRQTTRPTGASFAAREREHAHELLQRYAGWWEIGCASRTHGDAEDRVTPVFFRIRIDRITGRRAQADPHGRVGPPEGSQAEEKRGWAGNLLHKLAARLAKGSSTSSQR
jgi:nitroimidazol reductase NimA-like FMN-containing flavoprotein (pyridoxamine 5'-phosphate oxidase superfamily)